MAARNGNGALRGQMTPAVAAAAAALRRPEVDHRQLLLLLQQQQQQMQQQHVQQQQQQTQQQQQISAEVGQALLERLLLCPSCAEPMSEPCLLACFHSFCDRCTRAHMANKQVSCPSCGKSTFLPEDSSLPPRDELLQFLLHTSNRECPRCANCDRNEKSAVFYCNTCVCWSSQRECDHLLNLINRETGFTLGDVSTLSMFYCNTCGQALCGPCRDETHKAKMFSQHDIIHISMKMKKMVQKCDAHNELLTMFCTTTKSMLCMKCFSESSLETRLHCVDLDLAYEQARQKLERALGSLRELQSALHEGGSVLRDMIEDLRRRVSIERDEIISSYNGLYDNIKRQYETAMRSMETDFKGKDARLFAQLTSVGASLPMVQVHFILTSIFAMRANKHEFLGLAHALVDRLALPSKSDLVTNYKEEFANSVQDIFRGFQEQNLAQHDTSSFTSAKAKETSSLLSAEAKLQKQKEAITATYFAHYSRIVQGQLKDLNCQLDGIRDQLSVMHRDISSRRRIGDPRDIHSLCTSCATMKDDLEALRQMINEQRGVLVPMWDEQQARIANEQAVFKEQVHELGSMHKDLSQIICIAKHLQTLAGIVPGPLDSDPVADASAAASGNTDDNDNDVGEDDHGRHSRPRSRPESGNSRKHNHQHFQTLPARPVSRGDRSSKYGSGQNTIPRSSQRHSKHDDHHHHHHHHHHHVLDGQYTDFRDQAGSRLSFSSEDLPVRDSGQDWDDLHSTSQTKMQQHDVGLGATKKSGIFSAFLERASTSSKKSSTEASSTAEAKGHHLEPPGIGKSSRVAPVGGVTERMQELSELSTVSDYGNGMTGKSVEVLSMIRFSKSGEPRSLSSDTRAPDSRFGGDDEALSASSTLLRRSSAPEIDDVGVMSACCSSPLSAQSRSLDHLRDSHPAITGVSVVTTTTATPVRMAPPSARPPLPPRPRVPPPPAPIVMPESAGGSDSFASSDSESLSRMLLPRRSEGAVDFKRAVARLEERRMQMAEAEVAASRGAISAEVRAMVHRSSPRRKTQSADEDNGDDDDDDDDGESDENGARVARFQTMVRRKKEPAASSVAPAAGVLKKADSFEGHEEAVRTLVKAVQETRKKEAAAAAAGAPSVPKKKSSSADTS